MLGIVFIRKLWNMTAEDVADAIGIHRTAVTAWERKNHVPKKRLEALSKLFWGLDKEYFSKQLSEVDELDIQQFRTMEMMSKRQSEYEKNTPEQFRTQSEWFYQQEREQKHIYEIKRFLRKLFCDLIPSAEYDDVSEQEYRLDMYKIIFEEEKSREVRIMLKAFLRAYESVKKAEMPEDDFEIDLYNAIWKKQKKDKDFVDMMLQLGLVSDEDENEDLL